MKKQLVGVGDVFDIEQLDLRVGLGIEVLVHILQHILDAYLLTVAYRPHAVELEAFDDGTLENKHRRGTGTRDEVDTLRIEVGDGQGEDAVVVAVQQSDAVGSYQGCPVLFTRVEDTLFEGGTRLGLFSESGRDDDEGTYPFLLAEIVHIVGAELRCHHQYGQLCLGDILHVVKRLDALY